MKCTWRDCKNNAEKAQIAKDGKVWANLCEEHHELLNKTIRDKTKNKQLLGYWVKAQGGAQIASNRILER